MRVVKLRILLFAVSISGVCFSSCFKVKKQDPISVTEPSLVAYPNPCIKVCNLSLSNNEIISKLRIFGPDGKEVSSNLVNFTATSVDLAGKLNGKYIAVATVDTRTYNTTFFKFEK
jgi:hypothetical protein